MAEEHVERQMIERALAGTAKSDDEQPLVKINHMRSADELHVGIDLPPLNTALVVVHSELAMVRMGAKDIVYKAKKLVKHQLEEAQTKIAELERRM